MKANIECAALLRAMNHANSVVERRNTIPILANVLIEAQDDRLTFRATDLEIEVIANASAVVEQSGSVTVSAQILKDIVQKLPAGAMVTLTFDPMTAQLRISAGRSLFSLATLPSDDFPMVSTGKYDCNFSIQAKVMARLLAKSRFSVATEDTRFYLTGISFHIAENTGRPVLRAVATDGHRLARIDTEAPDDALEMPSVIIPKKTVAELGKLLDSSEDMIAVSVSPTKIRFATAEISLTTKVIEGQYPDYTRVIPTSNKRKLQLDAREFSTAVDRVAAVSTERSRAVKLSLGEDRIVLSVQSQDSGTAEEELSVAYADEPLEIGFNARFLYDIANQSDRENMEVYFNTASDPVLMSEGDNMDTIYVVMPMRV